MEDKLPLSKRYDGIKLMREFYCDYNRMNIKKQINKSLHNQGLALKTSSAFKMSQIISQQKQKTNQKTSNNTVRTSRAYNPRKDSYFFKYKSRDQLESYVDPIRGQFKHQYTNDHKFIRPVKYIDEKNTKIGDQPNLLESFKNFYQSTSLQNPGEKRKDLNNMKDKIEKSKKIRTQISANLRHNYLLHKKYKFQTIQNELPKPIINRLYEFETTKHHIFPQTIIK